MHFALAPHPDSLVTLPSSTTWTLSWREAAHTNPASALPNASNVLSYVADKMDNDGWMSCNFPSRPSPSAAFVLHVGPLLVLFSYGALTRAAARPASEGGFHPRVALATARADGAIRVLPWWLFWQGNGPDALRSALSGYTAQALANLAATYPACARTLADAERGMPVLPWLVPDLAGGSHGAAARLSDGMLACAARAAWKYAGGQPGKLAAAQVFAPIWKASGPWTSDARIAKPRATLRPIGNPWRDGNTLQETAQTHLETLLSSPICRGDPMRWWRFPDGKSMLTQIDGDALWGQHSAHARVLTARMEAFLANSSRERSLGPLTGPAPAPSMQKATPHVHR